MDPLVRRDIWANLRRAAEDGCAVLITSSSAFEADAICDKLGNDTLIARIVSIKGYDLILSSGFIETCSPENGILLQASWSQVAFNALEAHHICSKSKQSPDLLESHKVITVETM